MHTYIHTYIQNEFAFDTKICTFNSNVFKNYCKQKTMPLVGHSYELSNFRVKDVPINYDNLNQALKMFGTVGNCLLF